MQVIIKATKGQLVSVTWLLVMVLVQNTKNKPVYAWYTQIVYDKYNDVYWSVKSKHWDDKSTLIHSISITFVTVYKREWRRYRNVDTFLKRDDNFIYNWLRLLRFIIALSVLNIKHEGMHVEMANTHY